MAYIEPSLSKYERKDTSQFGEDGVIAKIAECLGIETGTFFEFGIGPAWLKSVDTGMEGNFVALQRNGWKGVFIDGNRYPDEHNVRQDYITPLNINSVCRKHNIPADLDFMSIDVDGQELWIWLALQIKPGVMLIEYNGGMGGERSASIQFDVKHVWDGTTYHGATLRALNKIAVDKGYTLVWANGVNAAFIRDDLVSNKADFKFSEIFRDFPPHAPDTKNRPLVEI